MALTEKNIAAATQFFRTGSIVADATPTKYAATSAAPVKTSEAAAIASKIFISKSFFWLLEKQKCNALNSIVVQLIASKKPNKKLATKIAEIQRESNPATWIVMQS